ncbi:MAG TPA: protein kinase [Ktedonobacteraceae bacterium]|nr:protein kinase [Ktedonobacteraceae bacterium]
MSTEELQDGRYHRLRLLGSGGMGEVYLMQDSRVSRQVAIKVVRSEATAYPDRETITDATRLFQREARAIAALEHANILPLYDYGEETRDGTTMTYMVMPYCADGSLQDYLRQRANQILSPQTVAYLIEQAAEALQYAHEHEVIHLDVKPSNFLLRGNKKNPDHPTLLLADFGIARNFTTVASASRTIRGTPTSMAPEQWSSDPVFATDQYALAVMAYELLAGRPPFVGGMEQLMYQHFSVQPPPPSTFNSRLPAAVDAVILRALAKKPSERYASVTDFASALHEAVQQAGDRADTSTDVRVPDDRNDSANYATLDISQSEADAGISRLITLPGGKKMNVPIPAGVRNGQVIRLPGPNGSNSADEMVLTVAIKAVREGQTSPDTANTVLSPNTQPTEYHSDHDLPTIISTSTPANLRVSSPVIQPPLSPARKKVSAQRVGLIALITVFVVLVLVGTIILYASHQNNQLNTANASRNQSSPTVSVKPTATPSPSATATPPGLYIAGTYNGSILNNATQQTTYLSVFIVQTRGSGILKGSVTYTSSPQVPYALSGTVDMQGNFAFTVQQPAGQTPLYFYGTVVQNGSYLKGSYCSSSTGPCMSNTGLLYAGPRY